MEWNLQNDVARDEWNLEYGFRHRRRKNRRIRPIPSKEGIDAFIERSIYHHNIKKYIIGTNI